MTATIDRADLRSLTEAQLAEVAGDSTDPDSADARAELITRRAGAAIARQRERFADWEDAARANFAAAEFFCRGDDNMLNERGRRRKVTAWDLWHGSEERARLYASDDLIRFWDYHQPRPPAPRDYVNAQRDAMAEARARDEGGAPMTTETEQRRAEREARMAELVRQAHAEAPPKVDDATMAAYRENLAAVRAEAGLDAQSVPAGLRAPQTQAVAVAEPERAVATRAAGTLATSANPGDGMHALANLARFHMHYDYWDAPQYADLLAAWELQCAAMEDDGSPIWRALPRLIVAGMYGNGKSGTLDQIAMATGSNVLVECTYPGIRDRIAKDRKVVILDDAQMTFGTTGKASAKVRLIVNTHTKGRVTQDGKNGELSAYGQMAMAGLSSMLTGKIAFTIEDTLSRCLVLHKPRKPKGYHVPEIPDAAEAIVRGKVVPGMREWCMAYRDALRARAAEFGEGAPTGLPDLGGGGRGNDQLARPLLAVCDVATALVPEHMREALPREQWDWSARIRKALIFVAGVPEVVDEDESALESVGAAFDELWMEDER